MAAVASVRSRAAGAVAAVGVDGVGCMAKVGMTADEANEAETATAAKAVATLVVGLVKGAHAAKGWVVEATAVAEEKDTEVETVMTAAVTSRLQTTVVCIFQATTSMTCRGMIRPPPAVSSRVVERLVAVVHGKHAFKRLLLPCHPFLRSVLNVHCASQRKLCPPCMRNTSF